MPLRPLFALVLLLHAACLMLLPAVASAVGPPVGIDSDRVTTLLGALDDDAFDTRQAAHDELLGMGPGVVAYLREEHLRTASPEVKDRLGRLIRDLSVGERLRDLVGQLGHRDARYRASAETLLLKGGPAHLPALEAQLAARQGKTRQALQRIIAELSRK